MMNINRDLLRFNQHELPQNFVSIAVQVDDNKEPSHAAIIIRYKQINYLHHYIGGKQLPVIEEINDENDWYIYKILNSFNFEDEDEIGAILKHCKRICSNSKISYSFIIDGSNSGNNGDFNSNVGLPELGTCVGFCVNTLSYLLIDVKSSYFELNDWDDSEISKSMDEWCQRQVVKKYPDIDWTLYNAFKKRVLPIDYLCSSFFSEYPITKKQIEVIKNQVLSDIQTKF